MPKGCTAKCVGCGRDADHACPLCQLPTCNRKVGLCGHVEGICAVCVEERLKALSSSTKE